MENYNSWIYNVENTKMFISSLEALYKTQLGRLMLAIH